MSILDKLFAESPFKALSEHSQKVHACVELVGPIVKALLDKTHRLAADAVCRQTTYLHLAEYPEFTRRFVAQTLFP